MTIKISLDKIKELNQLNLGDEKIFEYFEGEVQNIVTFCEVEDAFWFAQIMKNLLAEKMGEVSSAGLLDEYKKLIIIAKWQAISLLPEEEILGLFENNFKEALETPDYDVLSRLKPKLVGMLVLEHRDNLKAKIREALTKNKQKISKDNILIEEKLVPPTIGNWLLSYMKFMGNGPVDILKRSEFFASGKNMQSLDAVTKKKIIFLFDFYEKMRLSSLTAEGMEETIPVPVNEWTDEEGVIREGRFEPITRKMRDDFWGRLNKIFPERMKEESPQDLSPTDIEKKYQENFGDEEKIKKAEEEVAAMTKNSNAKIGDLIYEEISPKDTTKILNKDKIIAALRVAAGSGELGKLLNDNRFSDLVKKYLNQRNLSQAVNDFEINSTDPKYLVYLLRYILEDLSKLSEEKSAGIGIQLVNLVKKGGENKYNSIVYFDEEKGGFVWAE